MRIGWFAKKQDQSETVRPPAEIIAWFETEIERHQNLLYGLALFFEGMSTLYSAQEDVLATHRKEFRNVILAGDGAIDRASTLLQQAKEDAKKVPLLEQFNFAIADGHPEKDKMLQRAEILRQTYERVFPGRPRTQSFTEEDTFTLMEAAAEELARLNA